MKKLGFVLALTLLLLSPRVVLANIIFQYVTDQTTYSSSSSITVSIYLQETDTGNSASFSQSKGFTGINSTGIYVTQTSASGTSSITGYTPIAAYNNQYASQSSSGSLPPNSIDFAGAQPPGTTTAPNLTPVSGQSGVYRLLVGSLTINPGTSTTFSLTSMNNPALLDPGDSVDAQSDNTSSLPFYDLDAGGTQNGALGQVTFTGANAGIYTFTVAAVTPEPGSLALGAAAASVLALGAWRRWRNRAIAKE